MTTSKPTLDDDLVLDDEPEENEVAIAYDIASYPSDLTLSVVKEMWDNGDIVIPDFQRNFVWSIRQSSLLIESFLLGLPVPQVFFYVDDENRNQVIDGQQRIMSVVYYFDGFFGSESIQGKKQVFRLHGLDTPFLANMRFTDLDEVYQRKLKSAVLRAINIRQLDPKGKATSVYHIFERLNTGGTPLKPQEIRNCVFRGALVKVLQQLNGDAHWRRILGKKTLERHQKDVELVLRMLAMSAYFDEYEKPMKEFLNRVMARERDAESEVVKRFVEDFSRATELIVSKLGDKPFHVRGPLNSSALDSVFATVINSLEKVPDDLATRYLNLLKDDEFRETTVISTSDRAVVKRRFEVTRKHLTQ